jgi:hypothetical protein
MILETLTYDLDAKTWSTPVMPPLDSERTLVLAFGSRDLLDDPAPLLALRRAYPRAKLLGCSSAGEIAGATVRDRSLSVSVTRFEKTELVATSVDVKDASESFAAGQALARALQRPDLRGVLVLSEGLGVNGSQLVAGLNSVLPSSVVVTGGLSGDGTRFERTWVCFGYSVRSGIVAAVGFYGDHISIRHGSKGGWDKFGPERVITRSEGNVLYSLDGKPALALYKEYLGDKAAELPASGLLFPLAMRATAKDDKFLVRTLLAVDHEKQSMTFAGDLPKGHLVQLMKADFDRLVGGAELATKTATGSGPTLPGAELAVAISCVGRRIVLGDRIEEEVEAVRDALPKESHMTGFYSYGEISPYAIGHSDLHNQTMTLTLFAESAAPLPQREQPARATTPTPPKTSPTLPAARAKPPVAVTVPAKIEVVAARPQAKPLAPRVGAAAANGRRELVELDEVDVSTGTLTSPSKLLHEPGLRVETFTYDLDSKRWSTPVMPPLDSERTLVLAFGSRDLLDDPEPLAALRRAYPKAKLLGCSSAGEIVGATVRDRSLSVSVARFEKTTLATAMVEVKDASESFAAGEKLAQALQRPDLRGVLVLSEGLGVNGSQLVAGLNAVLPSSVVVTGGLSGDGTRFERTWVCCGAAVKRGIVAAVGFYGDHISIRHGSKGGWDKFGPERVITRSEGNVLFSLDGKPALALYKEYLGDKAAELPASGLLFPLAMRATAKDDKFLVRTLLAVDHEKQSMTFAGDLPKGHLVQLMKADFNRLVGGAELATKTATDSGPTPSGASLAVAISCVGRRIVLGDRIEEEVEAVRDALPKEALVTGFYSYGEISPYAIGHSDLHNQTMTLTLFAESPTPLPQRERATNGATAASVDPPPPQAQTPSRRETPALALVERARSPVPDLTPAPAMALSPVTERSSAPPRASVREVAPAGSGGQAAGITFDVRKEGTILVVRLAGRMTETFKGAALAKQLEGDVLLDLGDVERVTSFGVREWLQLLQEAEPRMRKLYLGRCAEPIVNQMSMIRRFSGDGQIVSFYAPYACEACSTQFERLVDCEYDADAITKGVAPAASCPRCDGAGAFDDDAHTYFGFAAPHAGKSIPFEIRAALAALERRDEPVGGEAVEKTVEGRITRVKVNCKLDASVRWNRVLDGLEGQVVFDLGAAPATTTEGAAAFEAALRALVNETEAMRIEGCPRLVAERFVTPPRVAPAMIVSAILEGRCGPCGALRPVVVNVHDTATQLAEGQDPLALCKRCNAPLSFEASRPLLKLLGAHVLAATAPKATAPAASKPKASPAPSSSAPPSLATAPVVDPTPSLPAPAAALRKSGGTSSGLYAIVAALGLAVLGLGALVLRGQVPAKAAAAPEAPALIASIAPPGPAPSERASAGPTWSKTSDLPPPWVERVFVIDGDSVFVVGRGGPAANEEAALGMARSDALERLAANMLTELAGSPVHDFVAARVTVDPHGERQKEVIEPVARRYLRQVGPIATPERVDAISRQREQGVESFVRYKLSKPSYLAAVETYRQTANFQGLTVARFFPELEGSIRTEGDLIIVGVQPGWQGALVGVRPGDVVVSVNGHPVSTVDAFTRTANDEWNAAAPGSTISIELESLGARRTTRIVKPLRGPAP